MIFKIAFISLTLLLGCENLSEKREMIRNYRANYCADTKDSSAKNIAILAIKTQFPLYPSDGICTGFNND